MMSIGLIAAIVAVLGMLFKAYWLVGIGAVIFLLGGGLTFFGALSLPKAVLILIVFIIVFKLIGGKK